MLSARGLAQMGHVTPHTLRRTFVSLALVASGNDIRWVMAQVGHADHKMTYGGYAQLQRKYGGKVDAIIGASLWHTTERLVSAPESRPKADPGGLRRSLGEL